MSTVYSLGISLLALLVWAKAQDVDLLDQPNACSSMDQATMQVRICELQEKMEKLEAVLVNGLVFPNNENSEAVKQKRKNEFIRFGKRKNEFIRFGKRKNEFIRFGRSAGGNMEEPEEQFVAKRKNEFIRFG
ncbi:hypothetical protein FO519_003397 [Halicephalobus sp. NKZ332]|nr:hypothetical protein FO519_003397 [Halicephalobus sp. NKZ332]